MALTYLFERTTADAPFRRDRQAGSPLLELARNLLTYGFAEEIVEKIRIDSIRAQLDEAILNRLHARLEV